MRKIYILLVFLIVVFISSCGAVGNENMESAVDGVSFDYFDSYKIEENHYDIYLPNNFLDALYYEHKLGNITSSSMEWTVNFIYDVNYHVDEDKEGREVWNALYFILLDSQKVLDEKCGFSTKLFDPFLDVEMEYVLNNQTKEEASYVIFYTFLPVRLVNKSTNYTHTVGIPVNLDVLLKTKDKVENPFNKNEMMLWEDFLAI